VARLGHESGFSPDGRTFYATGTARESITAVDVTNPKAPHAVWQGNVVSHGMTLSDDGNRAYIADVGGNLLILDVSQIQARKPNPQAREVSRLTWHAASIPQNAIPFTDHGHPYVLEFDEYTQGTTGAGDANMVGAARIIDIADEKAPRVVANLRLQVNQPADHKAASSDPGAGSPVQGYAAHYCSLSTWSTRRSWRARSVRPACACSTSATSCIRRRSRTTWRRRSRGRRTSSWPATSPCPSR
jgi:hypothetical protein